MNHRYKVVMVNGQAKIWDRYEKRFTRHRISYSGTSAIKEKCKELNRGQKQLRPRKVRFG